MSIKELEIIDGVAQYDLIVIGSGSGNTLIGPEWDNKKVALIDGGTFGGTCLNVGCIPTKMFVYPATTAQKARDLNKLGIEAEITAIKWAQIRDRIFPQRIDKISAGGRDWRAGLPNVDYYPEYAHFIGAHTVETESGQKLYGRQVVIAAGSRAVLPAVPGIDLPQVHTNDTIMRLEEFPQRLVVLGGGVVAAEFSHVFSALGAQVYQVVRSNRILREVDKEVVDRFVEAASHQWNILLERSLVEIRENGDGTVTVVVEHDGEVEEIVADAVLAATGRRSNSDTLKASSFFDVDSRGFMGTDKYQRVLYNGSPVPGVFALGDVSSPFQLKHVANHEARTVQHNLSHPDSFVASDHRFVPAAVFSNPQIATVGLSEENARKLGEREGFEVTVKSQNYGDTAYGWAMEDSVGLAKLIARKDTGQLLGAHLVGEEASVLIQPLIQAMSFGLGVKDMARGQYWIHPALTEVIENALLGLDVDN
ncbi:mycothione reductase [Rothia dentocariosa]|uniref:mycothione reductase n=1 Tax=Rothia dentocariosa TaxID=2047 RepID=UPI00244C9366|nr:mycothione reductase [Rothia dentocariosa]